MPPKMGAPRKATCQVGGHADFDAAEDGSDRQGGLVCLHFRLGEIQFDAAKNGGDIAALKSGLVMRRSRPPKTTASFSVVRGSPPFDEEATV